MATLDQRICPETTAAILLAAGASRRYGADKLSAQLEGRTVLETSARTLRDTDCFACAGVVATGRVQHDRVLKDVGITVLENRDADSGLATSIRLGLSWAQERGADAVLIALADMPMLTLDHLQGLIALANNELDIAFTMADGNRMPPAVFGKRWFSALSSLEGDSGARALLAKVPEEHGLAADARQLVDIDHPSDIAALNRG